MKLLRLKDYRLRFYEHPRPALKTLKKYVRDGDLSGGFIDSKGYYWVDLDKTEIENTRLAEDIEIDEILKRTPEAEEQIKGL